MKNILILMISIFPMTQKNSNKKKPLESRGFLI